MRYSEAVVVIRSSSLSQYSNQAAPGLRAAVTRRNIPYGRGVVKHLTPRGASAVGGRFMTERLKQAFCRAWLAGLTGYSPERPKISDAPTPRPLSSAEKRALERGCPPTEQAQSTSALRLPPARASSSGGGGGQSRSPPAPSIPLRPARRAAAGLRARRGKSPVPRHLQF